MGLKYILKIHILHDFFSLALVSMAQKGVPPTLSPRISRKSLAFAPTLKISPPPTPTTTNYGHGDILILDVYI
jgi:hypothetical protein